jgi:hypothetical protein
MVIVIAINLLGAFGFLFVCQPIHFQWDYFNMQGKGKCIDGDPWYASLVIFNWVTDAVLLALPAWIIWPLRIRFAQKAALATILGTGGLYVPPPDISGGTDKSSVLGVSILRFVIVSQGWGDKDLTYKFATNYIWRYVPCDT